MRPASIVWFERLFLVTLAIGAVNATLQLEALTAVASLAVVALIQLVTFGVTLLLVLLISRRRSKIAAIILAAAFLVGLPTAIGLLQSNAAPQVLAATIVQLVLQIVALGLLLRPESRAWLQAGRA